MEKIKRLYIFLFLVLIVWFILFLLAIFQLGLSDQIRQIAAIGDLIAHVFIITEVFKIYPHLNCDDKKIFKWLIASCLALSINDLAFYIVIYFYKIMTETIVYVAFFIPFLTWLLTTIVWLVKILTKDIFRNNTFLRTIFVLISLNFVIIAIFILSPVWGINILSYQGFYQILSGILELIVFDLAILCLICSENRAMLFFLPGIVISIAGDFWIKYSFITKTTTMFVYGELFWFLGLILGFFGLSLIRINRTYLISSWFRKVNTIKSALVLWTFSVSIISFIFFCLFTYSFSIIGKEFFAGLPFSTMVYSLIVVLLSIIVGKHFENPFKKLTSNIEILMSSKDENPVETKFLIEEFSFLQKFIFDAVNISKERDWIKKELGETATQVAHDIRSPLAVLNALIKDIQQLPEQQRIMVRNATQQINDIANNLLSRYRRDVAGGLEKDEFSEKLEIIAPILDAIISEKRLQYNQLPITIHLDVADDSHGIFANINMINFKRMISNLINNAIEAMNGNGTVGVKLFMKNLQVNIIIKDYGCGMTNEKISEIFSDEILSTKNKGHGIGLASARKLIKTWHGNLQIESELGKGTSLTLQFPCCSPAIWFADRLIFNTNSIVVILDDDPLIHHIWQTRFANKKLDLNVRVISFYQPDELLSYNFELLANAHYLIDYELIGSELNGIEIIEKLKINANATLVTSRYENQDIQARCLTQKIKILPKYYAVYVPIEILSLPENSTMIPPDLILIDNDKNLTDAWEFKAQLYNKKLIIFHSIEESDTKINQFDRNTPIYIDSELGDTMRGEEYAKNLYNKGFCNLYLCTGYEMEYFKEMPWIKDIVSKEPQF